MKMLNRNNLTDAKPRNTKANPSFATANKK